MDNANKPTTTTVKAQRSRSGVHAALELITKAVAPQKRSSEVHSALQMVSKTVKAHDECKKNLAELDELKSQKSVFRDEAGKLFQEITFEKVRNQKLKLFSERMVKENRDLKTEIINLTNRLDIAEEELTDSKNKLAEIKKELAETETNKELMSLASRISKLPVDKPTIAISDPRAD